MTVEEEIDAERERAHVKHGDTSMRSEDWRAHRRASILTEEVGEVAGCLNDNDHHLFVDEATFRAALREELIQVAAMAKDWIAKIDGEF